MATAKKQRTPVDETKPRYRLTEKAYIDDRLLDPAAMPVDRDSEDGDLMPLLITYEGIPGWHMEPWNDAAKAVVAKHYPNGNTFMDPILKLTNVTESAADPAAQMAAAIAAMSKLAAAFTNKTA